MVLKKLDMIIGFKESSNVRGSEHPLRVFGDF